jgi:hypothetical protein
MVGGRMRGLLFLTVALVACAGEARAEDDQVRAFAQRCAREAPRAPPMM